jgi:hypothetical protein
MEGGDAVVWCQYGSPAEPPNIYHRTQYEAELGTLPDFRIRCMFVDQKYRRRGVSAVAVRGALDPIARPAVARWRRTRTTPRAGRVSVLYNGTRTSSRGPCSAACEPRATGTV